MVITWKLLTICLTSKEQQKNMQDLLRHASLQQLRIFAVAAEHQSFAQAADILHLTKPAVSMQISRLAKNIGLDLFEKDGRKVRLTRAGKRLYPHVKRITQTLREASEEMDALKGLKHGKIKIAMVTTARYFATGLISQFSTRYPEIEIDLNIANRENVIAQIDRNQADIAIMGRPPPRISVVAEEIADHPYVIVAPTEHPLSGTKRLSPKSLINETFLAREPGSGTRMLMDHFFKENDFDGLSILEMDSNESIKQAVMAGMGLAFISKHTIALETQTNHIKILNVKNTPIMRTWYVLHLADKAISPSLMAFKNFMQQEAPEYIENIFSGKRD